MSLFLPGSLKTMNLAEKHNVLCIIKMYLYLWNLKMKNIDYIYKEFFHIKLHTYQYNKH